MERAEGDKKALNISWITVKKYPASLFYTKQYPLQHITQMGEGGAHPASSQTVWTTAKITELISFLSSSYHD